MEFRGSIKNIQREWGNNIPLIQLRLDNGEIGALQDLMDKDLDIEIKPHHEKRSLNANAYLWVLCTKIAQKCMTSKDEIYEEMLQRYGYFYKDDDGYITVTVKANKDINKIKGHWKLYHQNELWKAYFMIKGSSEYDKAEMAHFLDMVVLEAKELGIETLPPDELERLKQAWDSQA